MNLNKSQLEALRHIDGPCVVVAGPGSGKTRVISHRIANMVLNNSIPPKRILAISFTKASSVEMKSRTCALDNSGQLDKVNYGTFHSIFFRILKRYSNVNIKNVIDDLKKKDIIYFLARPFLNDNIDNDDVMDIISEISTVKNERLDPTSFESDVLGKDFLNVFNGYEAYKIEKGLLDFDDMLSMTYDFLVQNPSVLDIVKSVFRYVLIDEFQDINKVQFDIVKLMVEDHNNIFVVGDEDQSIYAFRGSKPEFLIDFDKHFIGTKKIVLDRNYRSARRIIANSNKLIRNNKIRNDKEIIADRDDPGRVMIVYPETMEKEADFVVDEIESRIKSGENPDDFAVIFRTNSQIRPYIDALINKKINFILKDSVNTFYNHWICDDLITYLRLSQALPSNEDWRKVINKPMRYISKTTIDEAVKSENFIKKLLESRDLNESQVENILELLEDVKYMRGLSPRDAIRYIRVAMDYNRYLLELATQNGGNFISYTEILDEFEEASERFTSVKKFLEHIETIKSGEGMKKLSSNSGVTLTTMHSSKGLEFKNVYISGCIKGIIPHKKSIEGLGKDEEEKKILNIEEERRLFYVSMTRAKDYLVMLCPKSKLGVKTNKSIFIQEILDKNNKKI